ncbi:MAG: hypothetical protein HZB76_05075 [Chlamydiae bacterium]|nr:hypothetical protein [Chlamydiota bacterium]
MISFIEIIKTIPWFAWLLFFYVILKGVKALRPQVLSIKKVFVVPLIFVVLGINGLMMKQNLTFLHVAIWMGMFTISAYLIWRHMRPLKVQSDKQKGLIQLPANASTLVLLLSFFVSKFTFGFLSATHPELKANLFFYLSDIMISGLVCGLSFGRLISLLMKFFKSSHVDLQKTN